MNAHLYTKLMDEQRNRLFSRAFYLLRDREDAEDVIQEAYLRLWRQGDDVAERKLTSWLCRVVHNLCIDQTRRRKVIRNRFGQPDAEAADRLPAGDRDPEHALLLDQEQEHLLTAMDGLPPETRDLLLMHYFQGMKLQEIADVLDKSLAAVKVQLHRARHALRAVLRTNGGTPLDARRETG